MAQFMKAFPKTMEKERGYSNHSADRGGETYRGISRRWHPSWPGWKIIDAVKAEHAELFRRGIVESIDAKLGAIEELSDLVVQFYKEHFWDRIQGDLVKHQAVADELFDTAVNMDPRDAIRFLQESLNCLNRNQGLFPDLVVDGWIGRNTMTALDMLDRSDITVLLKMLNVCQGRHYMDEMRRSHDQEVFTRGWFKRVEITRG